MFASPAQDIKTSPLYQSLYNCGQLQILKYWDSLKANQQTQLLQQLKSLDLTQAHPLETSKAAPWRLDHITPPNYVCSTDTQQRARAQALGQDALQAVQVALLTVAGGQATRLGLAGPKGVLKVTPVKHASLFEVFAQKIISAQNRYKITIPWVIMTSLLNQEATQEFFDTHKYWGLDPERVFFIPQGQMPVTDCQGKFLLQDPYTLAMSPDGHGGVFKALNINGLGKKLKDQGVKYLSYFQVDNPLVHVVDPVFAGLHIQHGSEFSSKIVLKQDPDEKVGLFVQNKKNLQVIEYTQMPLELKTLGHSNGGLLWCCANIAVHMLDLDFCERMAHQHLPYHPVVKTVTALNAQGQAVPTQGIKYEQFIFDALPFAKNPLLVQTQREQEFSPVKNALGPDSLDTCRTDQVALWARWFEAAGIPVPRDGQGQPMGVVEISPTFAHNQESFVARVRNSQTKLCWAADLYLK